MVIAKKSVGSSAKSRKIHIPKDTKNYKHFTRSKAGTFFYFSFIILAGLFSMLPLIYAVTTSFKPLDELLLFPPKLFTVQRPTFENYSALPDLLSELKVPLSRYIFNSVFVSVVTTVLYVFLSAMAAFVLAKTKMRFRNVIFVIVQFSLLFNAYTLAVPRYLIYSYMNIIDTYWVYILPHMASTLGVFLMKQYMQGYVPDSLLEAAEIDGAGYFRIFFEIVVPISKPIILTVVLFGFREIWASIPVGTIFKEELKTLPMIMTQVTAGGIARSGSAMAVSVIMMIPPILVYLISQSNVVESMSSAGIKG